MDSSRADQGSIPFPDGYRDQPFYKSDHFLGAAWKNLPTDLSRPTLGWRALDVFDDMNQWGQRKQLLGEVDVFEVQPDYELYGPMNVNYLKLDKIPKFAQGWQPVFRRSPSRSILHNHRRNFNSTILGGRESKRPGDLGQRSQKRRRQSSAQLDISVGIR